MVTDFKIAFLILAVICQIYYVDTFWGGRSRSSRSRTTSIRRGGFWSGSRRPSVRRPSFRRPTFRRPTVRRGGFWSRNRRPVIRRPIFRRPSIRRPSVRRPTFRRGGFWSRNRRPVVRKPIFRRPSVRRPAVRRTGWFFRRSSSGARTPKPRSRRTGWFLRRSPSNPRTPRKPNFRAPVPRPKQKPKLGPLQTKHGQLTFDAEGNDKKGSRYFSRVPHVPTRYSGITLGRGYDLKYKTPEKVFKDLRRIGIPKSYAEKFSKGAGLNGNSAKNYLKKNGIQKYLITHEQQKKLFDISYKEEAAEAKRVATKSDVVKAYGKTDWNKLNSAIKNVVVDLKFRGDYKSTTRKKIQAAIASNDLKRFTKLMSDRDYWVNKMGVPEDRFKRRKAALEKAKQ